MTEREMGSCDIDTERMHCMEVWGGNSQVDRSFEMPGLKTWVYSRPYGSAVGGGDVYYVSSCASGRITRLLLADVSGHGAGVSELALGLRELMRENVNVVKQTRFVEGMNQQFAMLSAQGAFATALVATFFQPTRQLTLCNAGHPAPLLYKAASETWSRIEPPPPDQSTITGTPLGIIDEAQYPQVQTPLEIGDMVLLFSDALTESLNVHGDMVGEQGLLEQVQALQTNAPSDILRSVVEMAGNGQIDDAGGKSVDDDLTAVLIQATGSSVPMTDNLLALFRLMRPVHDQTSIEQLTENS